MPDLDGLPPRRPLPADVRRAARRSLLAGLEPRSGRRVVAAIGVAFAVLAVPSVVTLSLVDTRPGGHAATAADPGRLTVVTPEQRFHAREQAPADVVRRCTVGAGDVSRWRPLLTVSARGDTVVAFRTPDGDRFCEVTPQTVAVSAAASVPRGGRGAVTFVSGLGTVAGVVDPAVRAVSVSDPDSAYPMTDDGEPAVVRDGVFVVPNTFAGSVGGLRLAIGGTATAEAASVTVEAVGLPPAVAVRTDRPRPAADRTSAHGRALGDCLGAAVPPVVDLGGWEPGAALELDDSERIVLGRYRDLLAVCVRRGAPGTPGTPTVTVDEGGLSSGARSSEVDANPFFFTRSVFYNFRSTPDGASASDVVAITGLTTDPRVAAVGIDRPHRAPVTATVVNGTFVLPGIGLNEGTGPDGDRSRITAVDREGRALGGALIPS
ncbi:hypothetical protein COUCH_22150 [Couchioplanes caeruleus]|uniref:hypothetical protein n=1 Tax=Couchioplanes caeruleus TaxID=56438 RepID=UPI0020BDDD66|nr:hypothetical protein [Couchioplanes caeruleus]UQU61744.1 hypothetical protein COUCH_22150 [Couchioplanes caeruleus]